MIDQGPQAADLDFLVAALRENPVQDVGKGVAEFTKTGTEVIEAEALRVVSIAGAIQESRHFPVGSADKPPQFRRGDDDNHSGDDRSAVHARL